MDTPSSTVSVEMADSNFYVYLCAAKPLPPKPKQQRTIAQQQHDASNQPQRRATEPSTEHGADSEAWAAEMVNFQQQYALQLVEGQTLAEPSSVTGVVTARRQHGTVMFLELGAEKQRVQLVVEPDQSSAIRSLLWPGCVAVAQGQPGRTRRGELSVFVSQIDILKLQPTPFAVERLVQLVLDAVVSVEQAARAMRCESAAVDALVQLSNEQRALRHEATLMALLLQGKSMKRIRHRPRRLLRHESQLLENLETKMRCIEPEMVPTPDKLPEFADLDPASNVPQQALDAARQQYIDTKKKPQIVWMLAQV